MPVTQQEFDAAQEKLVADIEVIHQFTTANDTTTIDAGGGKTIPSLAKVIKDSVGELEDMVNKDGTGASGLWDIDVLGQAQTVETITKDQTEAALGGAVLLAAEKNAVNGLCPLDANKLVPAINLPSYVDDVVESDTKALLPTTGERGKIYIVIADESRGGATAQYRWSGSAYVRIVSAPGSTDEVTEGTGNKYFSENRVLATLLAGLTFAVPGLVSAADSVVTAIGKLQAQVTAALGYARSYDFHAYVGNKPAAGATVLFVKAGRAFTIPALLAGSQIEAKTAAAAACAFTLQKNGTTFATVSFAAGAATPTVTGNASTSFAVGDKLTVVAPAAQDANLADIAMTILGTQN